MPGFPHRSTSSVEGRSALRAGSVAGAVRVRVSRCRHAALRFGQIVNVRRCCVGKGTRVTLVVGNLYLASIWHCAVVPL